MPIDPNWIRNTPDHVRDWQKQRGLSADTVDRVIEVNESCRNLLHDLNHQRAQLKKLQQAMRPSKNTSNNNETTTTKPSMSRDEILQQRKILQESIQQIEQEWKKASIEACQCIWRVGSIIDKQVFAKFELHDDGGAAFASTGRARTKFPKYDFSTNIGLDISQAILCHTRRFFSAYPIHMSPATIPTEKGKGNPTYLDPDLAHAMCGCRPFGCKLCTNGNSVNLPAWLGIVAHQFPAKSIFGSKQLPQFLGVVGKSSNTASNETDTFQIVAMTAGTVWDSRTVQYDLIQQLKNFYETLLLLADDNCITTKAVPAQGLDMHELSRVELCLENDANTLTILGWVSNFGDSASRANEICFMGGSSLKKKEYVHFVHATVLSADSIAAILHANTSSLGGLDKNNNDMIRLPRNPIAPFLVYAVKDNENNWGPDVSVIPKKALLQQKQQLLFGLAEPETLSKTAAFYPSDHVNHKPTADRSRQEALSCPFDFIFPNSLI